MSFHAFVGMLLDHRFTFPRALLVLLQCKRQGRVRKSPRAFVHTLSTSWVVDADQVGVRPSPLPGMLQSCSLINASPFTPILYPLSSYLSFFTHRQDKQPFESVGDGGQAIPSLSRCCLPPGDVQIPFLSQLIIKQVVFVSLIPTLRVAHPSSMRYSAPKTAFLSPRACCESDLDSQPHSDLNLDLNF